ncbi:MAG TPA: hypothetical protein VK973_11515, partial [Arenicellales bacterium]|nr:hypothetical protein [Arenicellales bacterium]
VAAHIERLAAEGYEFADPEALVGDSGEASGVLLVVAGASAEALERIDAALAESGGRAVYAATGLERSRPDVRAIIDSGRWIPASAGPADSHRRTIDEQGLRGNPLTHSLHRSGDREEPADMRQRLDETMQQAASFEPGDGPRVLLYPGGDYGQLSLDTDERALEALRAGVARHFDLALAGDDHGFATPGDEDFDPLRVPARVVPAAWDGDALIDHLRHRHPVAQGRLQLAKALFWNAQHERADYRFAQAEAAGADRGEVLHHSGANAYREGDLASALERLRAASRLDPGNARIDAALEAAEWRRRPQLELDLSAWDDSDDRSFDRQGASVGGHLTDHLRLELFADNNRWQRDGTGEEEGLRLGLGGRWYFAEGHWLDGRLWRMDLDDVDNHTGGELNVHLPVPAWSGAVDAYARREQIETVEAVRGELLQEQLGLSLHTRIRDMWDLYADPRYIRRSDDNDGWMVEGRLVRRLAEWPFLGVGYRLRLGDSDRDPPEYWAPESLRQHQLYATWRGDHGPLYYNLSTEVGYARETATDWRFVWGGRARLEYAIGRRVSVTGELNRLETPDYDRTGLMLGVDLQF